MRLRFLTGISVVEHSRDLNFKTRCSTQREHPWRIHACFCHYSGAQCRGSANGDRLNRHDLVALSCEKECLKHKEHAVCKACADSCVACARE